jgi:5-hydroxyisourate hydrolase
MSRITTHVLDTGRGRPAAGMVVILEKAADAIAKKVPDTFIEVGRGVTDGDGRVRDLLPDGADAGAGVYRLRFGTAAYFQSLGIGGFFPEVQIVFQIDDALAHYHVPLLLSPFGYSTYRGS